MTDNADSPLSPPAPRTTPEPVSGDSNEWRLTLARSALENWGRHFGWCAKIADGLASCSCGLEEAIALATVIPANTVCHTNTAHVCGLQGFGRGIDGLNDRCPACESPAASLSGTPAPRTTPELTEAISRLRRIALAGSKSARPDYGSFLSTADAATLLEEIENGQRERRAVRAVLKEHWLTSVECLHESKQDVAHCYCTVWASKPQPNVAAAVDAWIDHVLAAASLSGTPAPTDWRLWKSHLIVCADCTAGDECAEGKAILGAAGADDAPWYAVLRSHREQEIEAPGTWRCFHCDEVFTDADEAREHFGSDEWQVAGCILKLNEGERLLLGTIRSLETSNRELLRRAQEAERPRQPTRIPITMRVARNLALEGLERAERIRAEGAQREADQQAAIESAPASPVPSVEALLAQLEDEIDWHFTNHGDPNVDTSDDYRNMRESLALLRPALRSEAEPSEDTALLREGYMAGREVYCGIIEQGGCETCDAEFKMWLEARAARSSSPEDPNGN